MTGQEESQKVEINEVHIESVFNDNIPHVGEQIFESLNTEDLIQCLKVSITWKTIAEKILLKRWKGKLLEVCQNGKPEIARILLDNLASDSTELNATNKNGSNVLMIACKKGHKNVVKLILDHPRCNQMDINAKDNDGNTALIYACFNGHKDVVQLLLDHPRCKDMDINAKDNDGMTALLYACYNGHKDVVQLLLEHPRCKNIRGGTGLARPESPTRPEPFFQAFLGLEA